MSQSTPDGVILNIHVIPRARRSELAGTRGNALLVRLHAPPVGEAANVELRAVMAAALEVPKQSISIIAGEHSRHKRLRVSGVDTAAVTSRLARVVPEVEKIVERLRRS